MSNTSTNRFILFQKTLNNLLESTFFLVDNRSVKLVNNSLFVNPFTLEKKFCFKEEIYIVFFLK